MESTVEGSVSVVSALVSGGVEIGLIVNLKPLTQKPKNPKPENPKPKTLNLKVGGG